MANINGFDYSNEKFENYKLRLIVEITDKEDKEHRIVIYTTQTNVNVAYEDLLNTMTDRVATFKITHNSTKQEDDMAIKEVEKWINKIKQEY